MRAILDVILAVLDIYWFIIIATAVMSWLVAFNVINVRNDLVQHGLGHAHPAHRARAAADPRTFAEYGRRRYLADHRASHHLLHRALHRLLRLSATSSEPHGCACRSPAPRGAPDTARVARFLEGETRLSDGSARARGAGAGGSRKRGGERGASIASSPGACGVARSRVSLVAGHGSRLKSVRVEGEPSSLTAALEAHRQITPSKKETA